ncbi:hypothetical protein [Streptomyces sp. NBC_00648]|uniref:hypothetical protein n=1 Tax=Streptomyces sp. NBC_00648 TaxID=2975797 RepID=UPI0032456D47
MRWSRAGAIALLLPAVLAPAGCGVRPSEVVEVGDPANVQTVPDSAHGGVFVYLKGPDGALPVTRTTDEERVAQGGVLLMLFDGPTEADRAAGLTSDVPSYHGEVGVSTSGTTMEITLTRPVRDFSAVARQQLVCTAAHSMEDSSAITVVLRGSDTSLDPEPCRY